MELTAELESYGLNTEDCEDRHDLEKKLIGARRGSYREGKIKTSRDAGGYLQAQDSKGPGLQSGITSASQENKAAAFDEAMSTTMRQRANSFDAAIQDKLASIEKRGQKVFDLLEYPCEHEIKIVGAKAMKIGKYGWKKSSLLSIGYELETQVRSIVGDTTGTDPEALKTSSREKGKWVSVSVFAPVSSSEMLYDIYAKLNGEESFRFVI